MPTSHKKFGEALAILAGDALVAEAFSCIASSPPPPKGEGVTFRYLEILHDIAVAAGACGMTGGQALDLAAEGRDISIDELRKIHKHKTGALITVSVTSGAKAALAGAEKVHQLKKYGEAVGLAFQITDDILDVEGTTAELGKPAGSDIENNKATYPALLGAERSKKLAKEQVDAAYSALASFDSKADALREIARYILTRKN